MSLLPACSARWLPLIAVFFARLAAQAPNATVFIEPPPATALPAALAAFAANRGISIEGFELAAEPGPAREGDTVTALVTLRDGKKMRQWLTRFRIAALTDKERAENPPKEVVLTGPNGRVQHFATGASLALDIVTAGPFTDGQKTAVGERRARAFISPDILGIGLDRSCRTMLRLFEEQRAKAGVTTDAAASVTPHTVLSEADDRAVIGFLPALVAFFQGVQSTPGLREILWDIVEKPSVWSIIKRGGKVDTNFKLGEDSVSIIPAGDWTAPNIALHRMSPAIFLNSQPALTCSLFVTAPVPPLLTTAGIIGIVAEPPHRKDKRLEIRVIAAHRGAAQ